MRRIPDTEEPNRYTDTDFLTEAFVEVMEDARLRVKMQYPLLGMKHAETHCYVRKTVYEMLQVAASKLPRGYRLQIQDAWRPFALQKELFEVYSEDILKQFSLQNAEEQLQKETICKFVSDPVMDREVPPVHTTGGAVDVTIVDERGVELNMGTGFDAFTPRTYTSYFEKEAQSDEENALPCGEKEYTLQEKMQIRENRRLLYHCMTEAGFTNLPSEWWHYDYGDRFWAYYCQKPAIYDGRFTKETIAQITPS